MMDTLYKEVIAVLTANLVGVNVVSPNQVESVEFPAVVVQVPTNQDERMSMGGNPYYDMSGSINIEVYTDSISDHLQTIDNVKSVLKSNWGDLSVQMPRIGQSTYQNLELNNKILFYQIIPILFSKK